MRRPESPFSKGRDFSNVLIECKPLRAKISPRQCLVNHAVAEAMVARTLGAGFLTPCINCKKSLELVVSLKPLRIPY
jgi:hypothetical protein